jgi:hypothetical protein
MQPKPQSLDIPRLRRSFRKKARLTVADILVAFGRGVVVMVKEIIAILVGALILFCLVVAAMMVDIPFGRQVLLASIILGLILLTRRIGHWLGGNR